MKRLYLQEVICQAFHTNTGSDEWKVKCNKTISTFNLIITVLMMLLLYMVVFKTAAHIVFNTPIRYIFKFIAFWSFGVDLGFYIIVAMFSYFVYHGVMTYMYWNQYDEHMIQHHNWKQSSTAYSVLLIYVIMILLFAYYNFIQRSL